MNQLRVELPQEEAALGASDQQAGSKAASGQKPCHFVADEAGGSGYENAHENLASGARRIARLCLRSVTRVASVRKSR
jgi:hypothetical protein